MLPADLAAAALCTDAGAVVGIERIKHGLTNESWLVRVTRGESVESVVVRISNPAENLQIDRYSESLILRAVDAVGIGAPVLLCDPERRVLVTRYLGETWSNADTQVPQNLIRLGSTIRLLHSLQAPAAAHRVRLSLVVDGYLQTLQQRGSPQVSLLGHRASDIASRLDSNSHVCLCHNDIHRLNIVDDGRIRFIDWEYAGLGSAAFDLASVCVYHQYDSEQRARLLSAYGRAEVTDSILDDACELFTYIRDLWTEVRQLV